MKNLQEVRDLLTEALAGKTLQYRVVDGWEDIPDFHMQHCLAYKECRVKPEIKPDKACGGDVMGIPTIEGIRSQFRGLPTAAWYVEVAHYLGKKVAIARVRRMMNTIQASDGLKLALDTYEIRVDEEMQTDMGG